jgi:GNAT superfamily N-acetyltransferase
MKTWIRHASGADIAVLVHLEDLARNTVAARERGGPQWLAERPRLDAEGWLSLLARADIRVLVAGVDDVVVALAVGRLETTGPLAPRVVVEGVFVEERARGIGFGDGLLALLVEWGQNSGAGRIESTALPGDRETKNLFERAGMSARLLIVSRRLDRR